MKRTLSVIVVAIAALAVLPLGRVRPIETAAWLGAGLDRELPEAV